MKKSRFYVRLLIFCMVLALSGLFGMPACGESSIHTVKVGFFHMDGYHEMDENGVYSGYDYDFFRLLGRYTSLNFEFVGYDKSWQEMQEMLADGEIDILTSMHLTEERQEKYDFTYDIGTSYTMLTIKTGDTRFQDGEYTSYDGMKVGMINESSQNLVFEQFAEEKGFTYIPVYFESMEELTNAIRNGTVDAAVTSSLRQLTGERVIEEISPGKFYAVVQRGNQELLDEINQGITQMDLYEGDWRNTLYYQNYGYQKTDTADVSYSEREQKVLKEYSGVGPVLRICFDPTLTPYSFVEDGQMVGILPDAIGEMLDSWGINYEFVVTDSYEEYQQVYQNREADIFPETLQAHSASEQQNYLFTDTYFTMRAGMLTKKSSYSGRQVIGVLKNQSFWADLEISDARIVAYDTVEELLEAVDEEEIDRAYLMNYTAQMYVNQERTGKFAYVSQPDINFDLSFAVNKDIPHEFCSIFNKNISTLVSSDIYSFGLSYIENDVQDLSLIEYLQFHPGTVAMLFVTGMVLVVAVMVLAFINIQRAKEKRINAERSAEREKQQRNLEEALLLAENANKAKTVFLSNMSHDIRTPMNAIIGFSVLADKHIDNKELVRNYISKISMAGTHLLSLINDVLDMSRIESGKLQLDEKPCSLKEVLNNLCSMISSDPNMDDLEFSAEMADLSDDIVICDRLRLNQVLLNLLGNAMKFTKAGGSVQLLVTEKPGETDASAFYEFHVKDTGIGMSKEFQEHLFEAFERERTSTVSGVQGTGLGLAISKNIVEMMGGTITVSSVQGEGSEFTVTIPMQKVKTEEKADPIVPAVNTASPLPAGDIRGKRILLVEDNDLNREIAVDILREAGLVVEEAEDGNVAVERLLANGAGYYQLVITDIQMPMMDGYTEARTIRSFQDPALASIPIIAMTANAFEEDRQKALEAGMNDHIAKPFELQTVLDTIERVLRD